MNETTIAVVSYLETVRAELDEAVFYHVDESMRTPCFYRDAMHEFDIGVYKARLIITEYKLQYHGARSYSVEFYQFIPGRAIFTPIVQQRTFVSLAAAFVYIMKGLDNGNSQ